MEEISLKNAPITYFNFDGARYAEYYDYVKRSFGTILNGKEITVLFPRNSWPTIYILDNKNCKVSENLTEESMQWLNIEFYRKDISVDVRIVPYKWVNNSRSGTTYYLKELVVKMEDK